LRGFAVVGEEFTGFSRLYFWTVCVDLHWQIKEGITETSTRSTGAEGGHHEGSDFIDWPAKTGIKTTRRIAEGCRNKAEGSAETASFRRGSVPDQQVRHQERRAGAWRHEAA
jgi:hypothetical protein